MGHAPAAHTRDRCAPMRAVRWTPADPRCRPRPREGPSDPRPPGRARAARARPAERPRGMTSRRSRRPARAPASWRGAPGVCARSERKPFGATGEIAEAFRQRSRRSGGSPRSSTAGTRYPRLRAQGQVTRAGAAFHRRRDSVKHSAQAVRARATRSSSSRALHRRCSTRSSPSPLS